MSITYEEALSTLTAMFQEPWNADLLDSVLRHFEGHMENTVDAVLMHGDADPNILVQRLESSKSGATMEDMDAELARQLAGDSTHSTDHTEHTGNLSHSSPSRPEVAPNITSISYTAEGSDRKRRGIPTTLPPDFLRIPGGQQQISSDEALARMLQDKLFQDEIRNNPEFAHLARGGRRPQSGPSHLNHNSGEDFLKAVQELGESAKARFQQLANKVKANIEKTKNKSSMGADYFGNSRGGASERRGLLDIHDDEEQEISFVTEDNTELRSMDFAYNRRNKSSKQD